MQTNLYMFDPKKKRVDGRPESVIYPASHINEESKVCNHKLVEKQVRYGGYKYEVLWARKHPTWGIFLRIRSIGPIYIGGQRYNGQETTVWADEIQAI